MSDPVIVARHRTAIRRTTLSRPLRLAINDDMVGDHCTVLDYGCGHGDDLLLLRDMGIVAEGWDPINYAQGQRVSADIVNLGYVINVIEDVTERHATLRDAWEWTTRVLIVSARLTFEASACGTAFSDGVLTARGTFQKFYEQEELRALIADVLGAEPVSAAPGTFYVFRDATEREGFLARRFRRRISAPSVRVADQVYRAHQEYFDQLADFLRLHGRLPEGAECGAVAELAPHVGSLKQAYRILVRVFGEEHWQDVRTSRSEDLLVYLALARFRGRPRAGDLAHHTLLDVKAFFRTYQHACDQADALLFAAGKTQYVEQAIAQASFGKTTPTALYVHRDALSRLPGALRVYEGCAQVLVGNIEGANIIKLYRREPRISYLSYPTFDREAHPALAGSLLVDLRSRSVHYRDYAGAENPPILHRKETFVLPDHPLRERFARLTQQEERLGLLAETETIGFRQAWEALLADKHIAIRGHRVVRCQPLREEDAQVG